MCAKENCLSRGLPTGSCRPAGSFHNISRGHRPPAWAWQLCHAHQHKRISLHSLPPEPRDALASGSPALSVSPVHARRKPPTGAARGPRLSRHRTPGRRGCGASRPTDRTSPLAPTAFPRSRDEREQAVCAGRTPAGQGLAPRPHAALETPWERHPWLPRKGAEAPNLGASPQSLPQPPGAERASQLEPRRGGGLAQGLRLSAKRETRSWSPDRRSWAQRGPSRAPPTEGLPGGSASGSETPENGFVRKWQSRCRRKGLRTTRVLPGA